MTTKTFDSVELMRELRAKLSQDMEHLTPAERLRYIQKKAASIALGNTSAGATQKADTVGQPTDNC